MKLEDVIEERLAGKESPLSASLRAEFQEALAAHEALVFAVGETIAWPRQTDRPVPTLPEDYEIVRELGRGGMGVVYLARQRSLDRDVAVKVLRTGEMAHEASLRRFLEEARHLAQFRHPNIVAIHEIGRGETEPFFTMEYIPGESLASRLERGPLTPTQAVSLLKQIAQGVSYAHEKGVIHRDLKPGNVLLDPSGRVLVTDFGLARDVAGGSDLTRSGELLGTPQYMAPEQARGQTDLIGEATDIHALGAILYEMLTGKPPHGNDAPGAVFMRIINEEPVAPRRLARHISIDLETICLKALAKNPSERYRSAQVLLEDLRRYESGEAITARRPTLARRCARLARRHWRILATVATTALLTVLVVLHFTNRTITELRAWGREREAQSDHVGAIDVYQRAWQKAQGKERDEIREDLVRCVRAVEDPRVAMKTALAILREDAHANFGRYDYLIAQALIADLKARHPGCPLSAMESSERDSLRLARTRLGLFLDAGSGSVAERTEARQSLQAIQLALGEELTPKQSSETPPPIEETLPRGTDEELRRKVHDQRQSAWERGKAAYVLARRAAAEKRPEEAKVAAREAYYLLRSVFPMYRGVAASIVIAPRVKNRIGQEAPACGLLREAHDLLQRLDSTHSDALRGGIRFHLRGVDLPEEITVDLSLVLVEGDPRRIPVTFQPHRTVPFQGQNAEVGVADGTYSLRLLGPGVSYHPTQSRLGRLLQIDLDQAPQTVTVKGAFIDVVVPVRQLKEVKLLGPNAGAGYDPTSDFLRWAEVPGASYYRVKLTLQEEKADARALVSLPDVQVKVPRVCLGALDDGLAEMRAAKLERGKILTWAVEAFDKTNHRIATSLETERPCLITRSMQSR